MQLFVNIGALTKVRFRVWTDSAALLDIMEGRAVILPDVNVLLCAFRADAVRHEEYYAWLQEVVSGDEPYGVAPQALASVLRISTHPRIFAPPSPFRAAFDFCWMVFDAEHCSVVQPGPRH